MIVIYRDEAMLSGGLIVKNIERFIIFIDPLRNYISAFFLACHVGGIFLVGDRLSCLGPQFVAYDRESDKFDQTVSL